MILIEHIRYLPAIIAFAFMSNIFVQDDEMLSAYKSPWNLWSEIHGVNVVFDIANYQSDWVKLFRFEELQVFADIHVIDSAKVYASSEVIHQDINLHSKKQLLDRYEA